MPSTNPTSVNMGSVCATVSANQPRPSGMTSNRALTAPRLSSSDHPGLPPVRLPVS